VQALFQAQVIQFVKKPALDEMVAQRVEFLTATRTRPTRPVPGLRREGAGGGQAGQQHALAEAVARYLFKLMAYKDEYEVARLHTDKAFTDKIAAMFEGDYKLVHHLAPPLAKRNDRASWSRSPSAPGCAGHGRAGRLKGLRGGALDPLARPRNAAWSAPDRRVPCLHRGTARA
jgi:indolepyruvate ferredoxin oxidoreductase